MRHCTLCAVVLSLFTTTAPCASPVGDGDWPYWRGPERNGMARGEAPLEWSDTKNMKWKIPIPGRGHSSPVVWGNKIFVTTAVPTGVAPQTQAPASGDPAGVPGRGGRRGGFGDTGPQIEHRFELLCLDRKDGKILWHKTAKVAVPHEGFHRMYGSFASNSPVTDGKHVYAFFGSRGLYCYDLNGKLVWEKDLGLQMRIRLQFGEGTAPVLYGDKIILNYDHEGDSFIAALDKNTGKELWRTSRDEGSAWSAPLVVEHKRKAQVVVSASKKVRSYDFQTGELIWECAGLGSNVIPAPVHQNGLVYAMSGHRDPKLMAIQLGRTGDLTGTDAIVWSQTRGTGYTPSPVLFESKLYVLSDGGMVSCYNATTGEPYYQQVRLPKPYSFKSSPVGANGKLYLASEDSDVIVLKMGESFEVLATNTIAGEFFIGTPAIIDGEIILRGRNHLYCITVGN